MPLKLFECVRTTTLSISISLTLANRIYFHACISYFFFFFLQSYTQHTSPNTLKTAELSPNCVLKFYYFTRLTKNQRQQEINVCVRAYFDIFPINILSSVLSQDQQDWLQSTDFSLVVGNFPVGFCSENLRKHVALDKNRIAHGTRHRIQWFDIVH